jgi:hypothetical protein
MVASPASSRCRSQNRLDGQVALGVGVYVLDVMGGVESAMWEGCPRTMTGVSQCVNAGARLLCTLDGVCVIVYV